ncbi:MAG: hypothetical protein J1G04_07285 [Clostridiales bacterium]|nr:hypothetical protein [Clostridiales bacterium]
MDKTDKALALAVDNAARIESTARLLRSHMAGVVSVRAGTAVGGKTSFGAVGGGGGVIVVFSGGAVSLTLDGAVIASGASPIVAEINSSGVLALSDTRSDAKAMVIACNR